MADREKVIKEYEEFVDKYECFSSSDDYVLEMHKAVLALLKEQEAEIENLKQKAQITMVGVCLLKEQYEEHNRLLSWLGKFCRHIDNGDKWLTDEENIAFFKEKMKQQFGWDTD